MENSIDKLREDLLSAISSHSIMSTAAPAPIDGDSNTSESQFRGLFLWTDGMYRQAPENWKFPNCNCKMMWDLWYFGDKKDNITPYRNLKPHDLSFAGCKTSMSRARQVMEAIVKTAIANGFIASQNSIKLLSRHDSDLVFDRAFTILVGKTWENRRVCEIMYNTVYKEIPATRKRKIA